MLTLRVRAQDRKMLGRDLFAGGECLSNADHATDLA